MYYEKLNNMEIWIVLKIDDYRFAKDTNFVTLSATKQSGVKSKYFCNLMV